MRETDGRVGNNVYFAGRLIKRGSNPLYSDNNFVAVDRLGSVRAAIENSTVATTTSYLPYGEEPSATGNDLIKFATYTRDASTGLDYADQRYYTSQFGRFMSADRFEQSPNVDDSGSWNKYSYTAGDPVNYYDPSGQSRCSADGPCGDSTDGPGGVGWPVLPPCTEDQGVHADCSGSPHGGGGGGGRTEPVLVTMKSQAKQATQAALNNLNPNCFQKLGVSEQTLSNTENSVVYFDGRTSQDGNFNIYQTLGPLFNVAPNATFNSAVFGNFAVTLNYIGGGNSKYVILGNRFFKDETPANQGITLVHELLHVQFSTLNDAQFASKFFGYNGPSDGASKAISDWLRGGCN